MTEYEPIFSNYTKVSEVPKDRNIFYRCKKCGKKIPSVPSDNLGCECGNIFIDKDCWRLVVVDLSKLEVMKKKEGNR